MRHFCGRNTTDWIQQRDQEVPSSWTMETLCIRSVRYRSFCFYFESERFRSTQWGRGGGSSTTVGSTGENGGLTEAIKKLKYSPFLSYTITSYMVSIVISYVAFYIFDPRIRTKLLWAIKLTLLTESWEQRANICERRLLFPFEKRDRFLQHL